MTDIQALQITQEFWKAMADEGVRYKHRCSKYELVSEMLSECPLCEKSKNNCYECLLREFWEENKFHDSESFICLNSVYGEFRSTREKHYAQMIADAAADKLKEMRK